MNCRALILLIIFTIAGIAEASFGGKIRKGNSQYYKKNYDMAKEFYKEAEAKKPHSPIVHYNIGNVLYRQENYEEAAMEYKKSLSSRDKIQRSKSYYNLGNAYYRLDRVDEAINAYKETLRLNPTDEDARNNLQYLLKIKKQPQKDKKGQQKRQEQKDKSDRDKKEKQQQKKEMSREDVERLLEMMKNQEREAAEKRLKPTKPRLPAVKEDW